MNIKSICFHVGGDKNAAIQHNVLANHLKTFYNIKTMFYCYNEIIYNYHTKKGYKCLLETKFNNVTISNNEKKLLLDFNNKLKIKDFKEIFFTDLIFSGENEKNENRNIEQSLRKLKFAKEVIDSDFYADVFVDFSGDEIPHNIFKIIAKSKGARLITYRETVFPERLGFNENELGVWTIPEFSSVIPTYEEENYINDFISRYLVKKKIFWGDPKDRDFKLFNNKNNIIRNIFSPQKWRTFYFSILRYINKYRVKILYNNISDLNTKKFFYLPLHYPLDSQITCRGKPFRDQISFALTISDFLPYDTFLVVKEHPHARGAIPFNNLKKLKKRENIILLDSWENSHEIVKKSLATIVINSTVALEALYYGTPVITFGRTYFNGHQLVEEFKEFYDFYKLSQWKRKYTEEYLKSRLKKFLVQAYRYSYPISAIDLIQGNASKDGLIKFTDSLINYLTNNTKIEIK